MRAGDLTRRLEFQAPIKTPDGMGGFSVVFVTQFTIWGAYWPLSGDEAVAAMQAGGTMTGKVRIRYRTAKIPTSWRIKAGNSFLNIASPPIDLGGKHRWLEIKVKEAA